MKRKELTADELINDWMVACYGITIKDAYEREPWTDSRVFYKKYCVTQEQYEQWEKTSKDKVRERFRTSKTGLERIWPWISLQTAPNIHVL